MDIGRIKWFGGKRRDGHINKHGYVCSLLSNAEYPFTLNSVSPGSMLIDELKKALQTSDQFSNRTVLDADSFKEQYIIAFALEEGRISPGSMKEIRELTSDEIRSNFPQEIIKDGPVFSHLINEKPDLYVNSEINSYFDYFGYKGVRKLFFKNFSKRISEKEFYEKLFKYLQSGHWSDDFWRYINWGKNKEQAHRFIKEANSQGLLVDIVFKLFPDCINDNLDTIQELPIYELYELFSTNRDLPAPVLEYRYASADIEEKKTLLELVDSEYLLKHEEYWGECSDDVLSNIAKCLDWNNLNEMSLHFIRYVEADTMEKAAYSIIYNGTFHLYQIETWRNLSNSCKVRTIIYWSNHVKNPRICIPSWDQLMILANYESSSDNEEQLLILSMLKFFSILYPEQQNKQKAFLGEEKNYVYRESDVNIPALMKSIDSIPLQKLGGHGCLMLYLAKHFNANKSASHALNTLLERCISEKYDASTYLKHSIYCDARFFKDKSGIYCPAGINRDCSGTKCYYKGNKINTSRFEYYSKKYNIYQYQSLSDFLGNLQFIPDLSEIGIKEGTYVEYPFKISAYVNRLVDMRPHMYCRCGRHFETRFLYSIKPTARISATRVYCPDYKTNQGNHDADIYLNYCWNCREVIDSRECKNDFNGYYLCMFCGAAGPKDSSSYIEPGSICPNCKHSLTNNSEEKRITRIHGIQCSCGHDGQSWASERRKQKFLRFD